MSVVGDESSLDELLSGDLRVTVCTSPEHDCVVGVAMLVEGMPVSGVKPVCPSAIASKPNRAPADGVEMGIPSASVTAAVGAEERMASEEGRLLVTELTIVCGVCERLTERSCASSNGVIVFVFAADVRLSACWCSGCDTATVVAMCGRVKLQVFW